MVIEVGDSAGFWMLGILVGAGVLSGVSWWLATKTVEFQDRIRRERR